MVEVTVENFEAAVLKSEFPVLVDFWATWCGPCRALTPHLSALAAEGEGRFNVVKINVEDAPELAAQFRVQALPTLVLFDAGSEIKRRVGNPGNLNGLRAFVEGQ